MVFNDAIDQAGADRSVRREASANALQQLAAELAQNQKQSSLSAPVLAEHVRTFKTRLCELQGLEQQFQSDIVALRQTVIAKYNSEVDNVWSVPSAEDVEASAVGRKLAEPPVMPPPLAPPLLPPSPMAEEECKHFLARKLVETCDETSTVASLADDDWSKYMGEDDWAAPKIAAADVKTSAVSLADGDWAAYSGDDDWAAPQTATARQPVVGEQDARPDHLHCRLAYKPAEVRNNKTGADTAVSGQPLDAPERSRGAYRHPKVRDDRAGADAVVSSRQLDAPERSRRSDDRSDDHGNGKVMWRGGASIDGKNDAQAGSDWDRRRDGRRSRPEPSESEVFPEKKVGAGVDFDKYDKIPVQVSGSGADKVKPIGRFSEAQLADSLLENMRRCGYDRPTPIQKYAIPAVLSGRDLMGSAQTGSGKTCAFMVPCLESLLRKGPPAKSARRSPCGLVLAPTRELVSQIHAESVKFSFRTGIRTCCMYGGVDKFEQKRELDQGCDILVATPLRLKDMYERNLVSLSLVHFFILDEADTMLDNGFEPQVRYIMERTDMVQRKSDRQSMMFSATFSKEVQLMASDFLRDYLFIAIGQVGGANASVSQKVVYAEEHSYKVSMVGQALKKYLDAYVEDYLPMQRLALVFVERKDAVDALETELCRQGVQVAAIHGGRTQADREAAKAAFIAGHRPVLVATQLFGMGISIDNVALVINFDMPKIIDHYVQRIGRTGRAGRRGVAVTLIDQRCACLDDLRGKLAGSKQEIPDWFDDLCNSRKPAPLPARRPLPIDEPRAKATQRHGTDTFGTTGQEDAWD